MIITRQNFFSNFFLEIYYFIYKEALSCLFAGAFFTFLLLSHYFSIPGIARYDFLFLGALLMQLVLLSTKIETADEVKVIAFFHIIGLGLELFKTSPGILAWTYPEASIFKIGSVPLYSGFMYAAVASYMTQAWRNLKLRLTNYPPYFLSIPLIILVYLNFFTHHFLPDIRWILIGGLSFIFAKTRVFFTAYKKERSMPLVLSFFLIGFFIWIAENIATLYGAWRYPNQLAAWNLVHSGKISSWFLFTIISFMIVANLKHFKEKRTE